MTDRHIRYSETAAFRDCRRRWMNAYHLGLALPPKTDAPASGQRDEGTIIDRAVRFYYWDGTPPTETVSRMRSQAALDSETGVLSPAWEDTFLLTERMAESYEEWIAAEGVDQGEVTLAVEAEFETRLPDVNGDRVYLHTHLDRIVLDTVWDQLIVEDTKTVGSLTKSEDFQFDPQLLTYTWVMQQHGFDVRRARHNMIRKVKRSTRQAKPPFCGRAEVEFSDQQIAAHGHHLFAVAGEIVRVQQMLEAFPNTHHDIAYPSPSRDCSWKCDFLPICTAHDDGSDIVAMRNALYVPYPEAR